MIPEPLGHSDFGPLRSTFIMLGIGFILLQSSKSENTFVRQGIAAYKAGDYANAAGRLGAALSTNFNDPILHYYLANSYLRLEQPEAAAREFRIAYALQPDGEVGRYAKTALAHMGLDRGYAPVDVDSLFVAQPVRMPVKGRDGYPLFSIDNLTGVLNHSIQLSRVAPEWQEGSRFYEDKLPRPGPDGPWFRIPDWFAGTWTEISDSRVETTRSIIQWNDLSPIIRRKQVWGVVKDSTGHVWDHPCLPLVVRSRFNDSQHIDILVKVSPQRIANDSIRLYQRWIRFTVRNQTIERVAQFEQIMNCAPIKAGYIQENDSILQFDQFGQQLNGWKFRSVARRALPPKLPLRNAEHDYLAQFRKYLQEHSMSHLVP